MFLFNRLIKANVQVTIAGINCPIVTLQSAMITCYTGPYQNSSTTSPVLVYIQNNVYASAVI